MYKNISLYFLIAFVSILFNGCKKDGPKIQQNNIKITARFYADKTNLAQGDVINFSDSTVGFPLTWKWTFEGGIPETSTQQHPKNIKYNNLGEYNVTLVVTNAYGKDSLVKKGYIKVTTAVIAPTVKTIPPYEIYTTTVKGGGEVTDLGTAPLEEVGICWNKSPNPTINDFKLTAPLSEIGDYGLTMEDLEDNTTYYYRAYAKSSAGIGYGAQHIFTTIAIDTCDHIIERFTDSRNGKTYRYTQIGGKTWMGDNLNYPTANSWCYNDNPANCDKYGRLYTIQSAKNACPSGWRLPTNAEWEEMISAVGENPGVKLKMKNEWNIAPATNDYCFSAVPAGYKNLESGIYSTLNFFTYWWTSSTNSENLYISKHISYDNSSIQTIPYEDNMAFSVRCVKN